MWEETIAIFGFFWYCLQPVLLKIYYYVHAFKKREKPWLLLLTLNNPSVSSSKKRKLPNLHLIFHYTSSSLRPKIMWWLIWYTELRVMQYWSFFWGGGEEGQKVNIIKIQVVLSSFTMFFHHLYFIIGSENKNAFGDINRKL